MSPDSPQVARRRRRCRVYMLGAVGLLLLAAGAVVATAAIPTSSGQINGCYQQNSGLLRVIDVDRGETCRSSEVAISWSQRGPAGPPGPPGPPGASNVRIVPETRVPGDQSRVLLTDGPLTFTGVCRLDIPTVLGPEEEATVVVSSTSLLAGFPADTNSTTIARLVTQDPPGRPTFHEFPFAVAAMDGTSATGVAYTGINNFGHYRECLFGGHVVVSS